MVGEHLCGAVLRPSQAEPQLNFQALLSVPPGVSRVITNERSLIHTPGHYRKSVYGGTPSGISFSCARSTATASRPASIAAHITAIFAKL